MNSNSDHLNEIDKEIGFATLVRGEMDGKPFWAYVSIKPSKYEEFVAITQENKSYRLTDYGDIIEYALDETEPSAAIRKKMEDEHGIDHNFENRVKEMADILDDEKNLSG